MEGRDSNSFWARLGLLLGVGRANAEERLNRTVFGRVNWGVIVLSAGVLLALWRLVASVMFFLD